MKSWVTLELTSSAQATFQVAYRDGFEILQNLNTSDAEAGSRGNVLNLVYSKQEFIKH